MTQSIRQAAYGDRRVAAGAAAADAATGLQKSKRVNAPLYRWAAMIHKWAGLIGAVWLAVLGMTGFLLNQDGWRVLQQATAPQWLTSRQLAGSAARNVVRILQIDPVDPARQIAAGPRGLWRSTDGGGTWSPARFEDGATPQIFAIEADAALGWGRLWIGSDNGLYVSTDTGATAQASGLAGERVTALARGATPNEMLGVIDKSKVFRFDPDAVSKIETLELAPLPQEARPTEVRLHRFLRSLHFGRGLFGVSTSRLINEAGGLAMFALALTGLIYWGFGKMWRMKAKAGVRSMSPEAKRTTLAWLYRMHAATIGVLLSPVLLYMALTGVVVDHDRELGGWLRSIVTPRAVLTPAFKLASWDERIDAIVGYPGAPGVFSVGNMFGMFTTADSGESWAREEDSQGKPIGGASRIRRIGDRVAIMAGNGSTALIRSDDLSSREAALAPPGGGDAGMGREAGSHEGAHRPDGAGRAPDRPLQRRMDGGGMDARFAPSDATAFEGGLLWRAGAKLVVTDLEGERLKMLDATPPDEPGVPMFMWLRSLHTGMLFWSEWRWVNDLFATLAVFLTLTGLIRWWRLKWM